MKKIKNIKRMLMLLSLGLVTHLTAQSNIQASNEAADWEHLDYLKKVICKPPEQCQQVANFTLLEYLKYIDELKITKSELAEAFMDTYSNSAHYDEALSLFLSEYFTPLFIAKPIDRIHIQLIEKLPRRGSADAWLKAYRLLPIDTEKKDAWLEKGNAYVKAIVNSNASWERKAQFEQSLYNRDINIALKTFYYLPKDPLESDYWKSLEKTQWDAFWNRLLDLLETYPDSERLTAYVMAVLNEFKRFSPELSLTYMKEALVFSQKEQLSHRKGFKALHRATSDNLLALEQLDSSSKDAPLNMVFTAMDGRHIDLSDMKGKVVLIDFWSTRCPPCIAAMPHLKQLYDTYKNKGFEIIGIANEGDTSKAAILKILSKTKADWPQRLDTGQEASVSYHALYEIRKLPTLWLIDKAGKLVEKDVKHGDVEALIRKYLNLDAASN
ncbi:TlpA family protein disulfide reductase [Mariniflexile jejuense]|uniref:TlpA family protein disulfide reductase n=1 Tax=Mariniflexile jejuense TaxID=1173582 RepID=A0ABW3JNN4_9FLAO